VCQSASLRWWVVLVFLSKERWWQQTREGRQWLDTLAPATATTLSWVPPTAFSFKFKTHSHPLPPAGTNHIVLTSLAAASLSPFKPAPDTWYVAPSLFIFYLCQRFHLFSFEHSRFLNGCMEAMGQEEGLSPSS